VIPKVEYYLSSYILLDLEMNILVNTEGLPYFFLFFLGICQLVVKRYRKTILLLFCLSFTSHLMLIFSSRVLSNIHRKLFLFVLTFKLN
jgi:hypothetical protein